MNVAVGRLHLAVTLDPPASMPQEARTAPTDRSRLERAYARQERWREAERDRLVWEASRYRAAGLGLR